MLQVRARVRGDLDLLREKYLPELTATVQIQGRDYPYRAYTDRTCLASAMVQAIHDLSYSNFKDEVTIQQGRPRHTLYGRVWGVMLGAERKLEDMEREEERFRSQPQLFEDFFGADNGAPKISAGLRYVRNERRKAEEKRDRKLKQKGRQRPRG